MSRGGFPGNLGAMQGLVKQAQKMQQELERAKQEAESATSEGSAGGGMVRVVVNGKFEMVSVAIDPQVVNANEVDMLQDLIVAASNEAVRKAQSALKDKLSKITGGVSIPGLF